MSNRLERRLTVAALALAFVSAPLLAQATASEKLRSLLPAPTADRVLERIERARASGLPAATLEQRALELSAKGVAPDRLAAAVNGMADRLETAREALAAPSRTPPTDDELEAAATALRKSIDGKTIRALAACAPSNRSVAVALVVVSSLVDRGLPVDEALRQVTQRLAAHASDRQLEQLADLRNPTQAPSLASQDWSGKHPDAGRPDLIPATAIVDGVQPTMQPPRPPKRNRP